MRRAYVFVLAPLLELVILLFLPFGSLWHLLEVYGLAEGALLFCFSSKSVWRLEAQVLGSLADDDAFMFKKSVQDECTMISIAAAIVAQIAITALSLPALSQTHWIARGLLIFSLTSSLLAVFYSTTQYKALGRLIRPRQIRQWIRGGTKFLAPLLSNDFPPCDPADIDPADFQDRSIQRELSNRCFRPSVSAVITISAPQVLLSTSIAALLLAIGVYLGFTWTRGLDSDAGENDSRNVFAMFLVGLLSCLMIYSISGYIKEGEEGGESFIIVANMKTWAVENCDLVQTWGYDLEVDGIRSLHFKPRFTSADQANKSNLESV